jgi:hypothetical protein
MSTFTARLRLPGHTRLPLGVEVDILHERMTLTAGDRTVANWPLEELEVASLFDGFHIKVGDEEMILNVADSKRFATELGIGRPRPEAHHNGSHRSNGTTVPLRPLPEATADEEQFYEMKRRISDIAEALGSDSVSPPEALARWLSLLKELNRRHGQGSMPTYLYCQLNSQLLDLMPEPTLAPIPA